MLIESLASMGHSSIWKLICAISVCYTLTVSIKHPPALVVLDPPLGSSRHIINTQIINPPGPVLVSTHGKATKCFLQGSIREDGWTEWTHY